MKKTDLFHLYLICKVMKKQIKIPLNLYIFYRLSGNALFLSKLFYT